MIPRQQVDIKLLLYTELQCEEWKAITPPAGLEIFLSLDKTKQFLESATKIDDKFVRALSKKIEKHLQLGQNDTKHKKKDICDESTLEFAGFTSAEQDLQSLQVMKRFSIKRQVLSKFSQENNLRAKINALHIYLRLQDNLQSEQNQEQIYPKVNFKPFSQSQKINMDLLFTPTCKQMHQLEKLVLTDERTCDDCDGTVQGFNHRCQNKCDVDYCTSCIVKLNRISKIVTTWLEISQEMQSIYMGWINSETAKKSPKEKKPKKGKKEPESTDVTAPVLTNPSQIKPTTVHPTFQNNSVFNLLGLSGSTNMLMFPPELVNADQTLEDPLPKTALIGGSAPESGKITKRLIKNQAYGQEEIGTPPKKKKKQTNKNLDFLFLQYLNQSQRCAWLFSLEAATFPCIELLQLDQVCYQWAQVTESACVCVRLASLTGNVSYLFQAIHLLAKHDTGITPQEMFSASLQSCKPLKPTREQIYPTTYDVAREAFAKQVPPSREIKKNVWILEGKNVNQYVCPLKTNPLLCVLRWRKEEQSQLQHHLKDFQVQAKKLVLKNLQKNSYEYFEAFLLEILSLLKQKRLDQGIFLEECKDRVQPESSNQLFKEWATIKQIKSNVALNAPPVGLHLKISQFASSLNNFNDLFEDLNEETMELMEPYFNFQVEGHKFIECDQFKDPGLNTVVKVLQSIFKTCQETLKQQEITKWKPNILALFPSSFDYKVYNNKFEETRPPSDQYHRKLESLLKMFKAKQWQIVLTNGWVDTNELQYLTVAVRREGKTSLLSYCLSSDCDKFRHDLPEIQCTHQVFHSFEVKDSNLRMITTHAMVDYATVYCATTGQFLTQIKIGDNINGLYYCRERGNNFAQFKLVPIENSEFYEEVPTIQLQFKIGSPWTFEYPQVPKDLQKLEQLRIDETILRFQTGTVISQPKVDSKTRTEQAFYLAKIIQQHSIESPDNSLLSRLHISNSQFYFKTAHSAFSSFAKINCEGILKALSSNLIDNLKVMRSRRDIFINAILKQAECYELMAIHSKIDSNALEHYLPLMNWKVDWDNDEFIKSELAKTNAKSIILRHINCATLELVQGNSQALAKKDAIDLLKIVLSNREVDTPEWGQQLAQILRVVHDNGLIQLLQAIVLCLFLYTKLPDPVVTMIEYDLVNTPSFLPNDLQRDLMYLLHCKKVKEMIRPVKHEDHQSYNLRGYQVTESEILSGGMIHHHLLSLISDQTRTIVDKCVSLAPNIKPLLHQESIVNSTQEVICLQVIHLGKNNHVDDFIDALQAHLKTKRGPQVQVGQDAGMKLCRAAFAVILKMSEGLLVQMESLLLQIEMEEIALEPGAQRTKAILAICLDFPDFQKLAEIWESAAKMRVWLQAKRKRAQLKINDEQQCQNWLNQIYDKIIEKADFLIKLETPQFRGSQKNKNKLVSFQVNSSESVLACLQATVIAGDIQSQVELLFQTAVQRIACFSFIDKSLTISTPIDQVSDFVSWLSNLQSKKQLAHYMDGIQAGCSQKMESVLRSLFFSILGKFAAKLAVTKHSEEAFTILYSMQWQFQARDFQILADSINIFQLLSEGDRSATSVVAKSWGRLSQNNSLGKDLVLTFKDIFFAVLSRVTTKNQGEQIHLSHHAREAPTLKRVKSFVNQDSSKVLLDSGVRAIIKTLNKLIAKYQLLTDAPFDIIMQLDKSITKHGQHMFEEFFEGKDIQSDDDTETHHSVDLKIGSENHNAAVNILLGDNAESQPSDIVAIQLFEVIDGKLEIEEGKSEQKIKDVTRANVLNQFISSSEALYVGDLLQILLVLTNVSRVSETALSALNQIASQELNKTVLELLKLPISVSTTHSVLKVIENLHKLDLLDISVSLERVGLWASLNNPLAELLFGQAKTNFIGSNMEKTKMLLTCASKFVSKTELQSLLSKLEQLDETDQSLVCMLLKIQIQFPALGDYVWLKNPNMPVKDHLVILESFKNIKNRDQKVKLFSVLQNIEIDACVKDLQFGVTPLIIPLNNQLIALLEKSSPLLQCMVLNYFLQNHSQIDETTRQLLQIFTSKIVLADEFSEEIQGSKLEPNARNYLYHRVWLQPELLELWVAKEPASTQTNQNANCKCQEINQFIRYLDLNQISYWSALKCLQDSDYSKEIKSLLKHLNGTDFPCFVQRDFRDFIEKNAEKVGVEEWKAKLSEYKHNEEIVENKSAKNYFKNIHKFVQRRSLKPLKTEQFKLGQGCCQVSYLLMLRASQLLFQTYKWDSNPNIILHLNEIYVQLKSANMIECRKKTGITKRWLEILSSLSPQVREFYVNRILDLCNHQQQAHFKLLLVFNLIKSDDKIASKFSVKFAKCLINNLMVLLYESKELVYQDQNYFQLVIQKYLRRLADLMERVAVLTDVTIGEQIAQLATLKDILVTKNHKQEVKSKQFYRIYQLRHQFAVMCTKLNIKSEVKDVDNFLLQTEQLSQIEFSKGSLHEQQKFSGESVFHFKPSKKIRIIEMSKTPTFEDFTCHVVESGTRELKLFGEEYFVRGEQKLSYISIYDLESREQVSISANFKLDKTKLFQSCIPGGYYWTNNDGTELYYQQKQIAFQSKVRSVVSTRQIKDEVWDLRDYIIDSDWQVYLIHHDEDIVCSSVLTAEQNVDDLALSNKQDKFVIVQGNTVSILNLNPMVIIKVEAELLVGATEIKLLSNHLLLGEEKEFLFLEARVPSSDKKGVFKIVIKDSGEVEFDYQCFRVFDSYFMGNRQGFGIDESGVYQLVSNKELRQITIPQELKGGKSSTFCAIQTYSDYLTGEDLTITVTEKSGMYYQTRKQKENKACFQFELKPVPFVIIDLKQIVCLNQTIPSKDQKYKCFFTVAAQYSEEQVASSIARLDSELAAQKKINLTRLLASHRSRKQFTFEELTDLQVLEANQKFFQNFNLFFEMLSDYKFDLSSYKALLSRFVIPRLRQTVIRKVAIRCRYYNQSKKLSFDRLDQSESLFDQLYRQTKDRTWIYQSQFYECAFRVYFKGEGATDYGGPFRDLLEMVCEDVATRYFTETQSKDPTSERRLQIPSIGIDLSYPTILRYKYIGNMIGYAIRSYYCFPLDFSQVFWKRILKMSITLEDFFQSESSRYNQLSAIRDGNETSTFSVDFGGGFEVELCDGGAQISVTQQNSDRFIELYTEKYLGINQTLYDAIIQGIEEICPRQILVQLDITNISRTACSAPHITLDQFNENVTWNICDSNLVFGQHAKSLFLEMFEKMTKQERSLLVKYITGSSKIDGYNKITMDVQLMYYEDQAEDIYAPNPENLKELIDDPHLNRQNKMFPIAHTCGLSLDLPLYTSLEIMTQRIITAITQCGAIDADYDAHTQRDFSSDYGGEDRGESRDSRQTSQSGRFSQSAFSGEGEGEGEGDSDCDSHIDNNYGRESESDLDDKSDDKEGTWEDESSQSGDSQVDLEIDLI